MTFIGEYTPKRDDAGNKLCDKAAGGCGRPADVLHGTNADARRRFCGFCVGQWTRDAMEGRR